MAKKGRWLDKWQSVWDCELDCFRQVSGWHIMTTQTFDKKKLYGKEFGLQRDLLDTRVYNYNYL